MRTLRLSLTGTVILALPVGLGGAVGAQDEPADPMAPAVVTGSVVSSSTDSSELELTDEDGIMHGGGLRVTSEFEWSDPRLPSQGEITMNFIASGDVGLAYHYKYMLEGPEVHWTGPELGFCDADDRCRGTAFLTGHGKHEGLFAVLVAGPQLDASGDVLRDSAGNIMPVFDGAIFFGDAPPLPEPPEPSAE